MQLITISYAVTCIVNIFENIILFCIGNGKLNKDHINRANRRNLNLFWISDGDLILKIKTKENLNK